MLPTAAPSVDIAGFVPTPNHILLSSSLSPESKLTYQIIRYHDRGRGCFACREKMAQEVGLSLYHLRQGICELVDHGIITLEKRRMGLTDVIRLVNRDWGLPGESRIEEPTEPQIKAFPEPDLSGEPQLPAEPVQVEDEPTCEPVEEEKPFEPPIETSATPTSNGFNPKNDTINDDFNNHHTPYTKPESTEPPPKATEKLCDELVSFFYESKENRTPEKIELRNWRPVAWKLLSQYSIAELKLAAENAIRSGARLFYYLSLSGPGYIAKLRRERAEESERQKHASKAFEAQQQQTHQLEALRRSTAVYDAETKDLLAGLESKMRPQTFNVWFRDSFITEITANTLTLAVPSPGAAEWIAQRYTALLQEISGKDHIEFIAG